MDVVFTISKVQRTLAPNIPFCASIRRCRVIYPRPRLACTSPWAPPSLLSCTLSPRNTGCPAHFLNGRAPRNPGLPGHPERKYTFPKGGRTQRQGRGVNGFVRCSMGGWWIKEWRRSLGHGCAFFVEFKESLLTRVNPDPLVGDTLNFQRRPRVPTYYAHFRSLRGCRARDACIAALYPDRWESKAYRRIYGFGRNLGYHTCVGLSDALPTFSHQRPNIR